MAKETYYFSHDMNARNDDKILELVAEHGWEGYGIYWCLVEMMFESEETQLAHKRLKGIAHRYGITLETLEKVIALCIEQDLFSSDGECFWSESLRRRKDLFIDGKQSKAEAGKKGAAKRWGKNKKNIAKDSTPIALPLAEDSTAIAKDSKGNEIKGNEIKGNKDLSLESEEQSTENNPDHKEEELAGVEGSEKELAASQDLHIELTKQEWEENFERFWLVYPCKRSKTDALKAWMKIEPSGELLEKIIVGVEKAIAMEWCKREERYIPYPANWLKGQGWLNEYNSTLPTNVTPFDKNKRFTNISEHGFDYDELQRLEREYIQKQLARG